MLNSFTAPSFHLILHDAGYFSVALRLLSVEDHRRTLSKPTHKSRNIKISEIFFFSTHISLMNQKKTSRNILPRESGLRRVQPKLGKHIKINSEKKYFYRWSSILSRFSTNTREPLLIRRVWKPSGIVGKRLKRDMKRDVSYKRFHRPPQLALNEHFSFSTADLYTFFSQFSFFLLFVRFFSHNC